MKKWNVAGANQKLPNTNLRKYMSFSPSQKNRGKPPTAGQLNAKTLAEENLKGFSLKNL